MINVRIKMKKIYLILFFCLSIGILFAAAAEGPEAPEYFVERDGNRLVINGRPFYFNAGNNDHLYYWSHFMLSDVLNDAKGLGLTAFRIWASSEGVDNWKEDNAGNRYCFQPNPRQYDEPTFAHMDYIIAKARELGIRLILPMVNNWDDGFGGMPQYTEWSVSAKSDLHMDIYNPGSPCQMAIALRTGVTWDWYEAERITLTNGWNHISVFLQSPVWMCDANHWTYTSPIANLNNVKQLAILVYSSNGIGSIYLDNVKLGPAGRPILWDNAESADPWKPETGNNDSTGVSISPDYHVEGSHSLKLDFNQALPQGKAIWKKDTAMGNHDVFFFDADCRNMYEGYLTHFITRTNTITGIAYKDDPTILMWELANEPRCESEPSGDTLNGWINDMAGYIKTNLDSNHLVSTGEEGYYNIPGSPDWRHDGRLGADYIRNNQSSYIDICSFHLYPEGYGMSDQECLDWIAEHVNDAHNVIGKPTYLGEFGITVDRSAADAAYRMARRNQLYKDWFNILDRDNASGAAFWQLLAHRDDGSLFPDYWNWGVYYPEDSETSWIIQYFSAVLKNKGPDAPVPPPTVSLSIKPVSVKAGEPFTLTITGESSVALASVWWFVEDVNDPTWHDIPGTVDGAPRMLNRAQDFDSGKGMASYTRTMTVTIDNPGQYLIKANARDILYPISGEPHQSSEGMGIPVVPVNVSPQFGQMTSDYRINEGEKLIFTVTATDANGDKLS